MKILLYILQKEFIQIFRSKLMVGILFFMPIFQLLVMVYAATFEIKRIDLVVVDNDRSPLSVQLINRIESNPIFNIDRIVQSDDEAERLMQGSKVDAALCIPRGFDKKLTLGNRPDVQILANAIVGNSAQLSSAYLTSIIMDFNQEILEKQTAGIAPGQNKVEVSSSYWYNATLNYKIYMAPGIQVVLITIVGMLLGAVNFVREKELGTIEQINVTPIKRWQLIAGKLLPFLFIGLAELTFGLALAHWWFEMPMRGSLALLYAAVSIYLTLILSLGLFVSAASSTQQQVAFVGFFFMMLFILLSGLFTPIESMPRWAQWLDTLNPLYYFVKIMRSVILKGAYFVDIWREMLSLFVLGTAMFAAAVWKYRKTN